MKTREEILHQMYEDFWHTLPIDLQNIVVDDKTFWKFFWRYFDVLKEINLYQIKINNILESRSKLINNDNKILLTLYDREKAAKWKLYELNGARLRIEGKIIERINKLNRSKFHVITGYFKDNLANWASCIESLDFANTQEP